MKNLKQNTILVLASTGILGVAYTPVPKPRPSKDFIVDVYMRPTLIQRIAASEARKQVLLSDIRSIRKEIRQKAESLQLDRNTRITAYTANQKTIIHSAKMMMKIVDNLHL